MTGIVRETILAMAMFHLHGQVIKRSDGRSVVNAAAYRAGEALYDRRLGKQFDYTRKAEVEESVILGPTHAATWMFDRELLWNAVEEAERRLNSQLAREFDIAIPIELAQKSPKAAKKAVLRWATEMFVSQGLVVDISFHDMKTHNPHAHLMVTMRRVHPLAAEFDVGSRHAFETHKARQLDDRGYMDFWRECWADIANEALAAEGIDARIDHRTLIEQGVLDREPGIHVGPNAKAMVKRGIESDRWVRNATIWFVNEEPFWEENRAWLAWFEENEEKERREAQSSVERGVVDRQPASAIVERPKLSTLEADKAWFVAEEDFWRRNREMLPDLERQEREILRQEAEAAERLRIEAEELDRCRQVVRTAAQLEGLATRLDALAISMFQRQERALRKQSVKLSTNKPRVEQLAAALDAVATRLVAARPQPQRKQDELNSLSSRLNAALQSLLTDRRGVVSATGEALMAAKPRLLPRISGRAAEVARGIREQVQLGFAAVADHWQGSRSSSSECLERTPTPELQSDDVRHSEDAAKAVDDAAKMEERQALQRYSEALELLRPLEAGDWRKSLKFTREGCVLDPTSLDPDYRELAERVADHPIIADEIERWRKLITDRVEKLINGHEPVVRREDGRWRLIEDKFPDWLRQPAEWLLENNAAFDGWARMAVLRWSGAKLPSASQVDVSSKGVENIDPGLCHTANEPSIYDQEVERRLTERGGSARH